LEEPGAAGSRIDLGGDCVSDCGFAHERFAAHWHDDSPAAQEATAMPTRNSLFRHLVRQEPEPVPDDPADMGTAFGLEASLGPSGEFDADEEQDSQAHPRPQRAPMDWLARRGKPRR